MVILANVMIPTVAEHVVVMLILLVPVALIEAVVLGRRHLLKRMEALSLSFRANLRSTLVGLPLGYLFAWLGIIPAGLFAALLPKHIASPIGTVLMHVVGHGQAHERHHLWSSDSAACQWPNPCGDDALAGCLMRNRLATGGVAGAREVKRKDRDAESRSHGLRIGGDVCRSVRRIGRGH